MRSVRKITGSVRRAHEQIAAQLEAGIDFVAEDDVENREIRHFAFDSDERFFATGVRSHVVALLGDRVSIVGPLIRIVFDDRDALCHGASVQQVGRHFTGKWHSSARTPYGTSLH